MLLNFGGSCFLVLNTKLLEHAPFGCGADAAGQISPVGQYEIGLRSFFFLGGRRTGHRFVYNNNPGEFRNT